jgi:glycosyltransferase involved in cell wall biosynthesis
MLPKKGVVDRATTHGLVLWFTNFSAPYRRPVWDAVGRERPLSVRILENDKVLERDKVRSMDWSIASTDPRNYSIEPVKGLRLRRGERTFYLALRLGSFRRAAAVVIGGWDSPAYWQVLLIAKLLGLRTVAFYESTVTSNRFRAGPVAFVRSRFFLACDAIVVPGVASFEAVVGMGVPPTKVVVGFNAVDVDAFALAAREEHPLSAGHRFAYVGQLIERKNVGALISAFAMVANVDDTLLVVGEGDQRVFLEQAVEDLGIGNRVRFAGAVSYAGLPLVMAAVDTLVLPSLEEVWGLVVNEALASGCGVVVSARAGVARSVEHMEGVIVAEPTVAALATALSRARTGWRGPILEPEILRHGTAGLAGTFLEALGGRPLRPASFHGRPTAQQ